MTIKFYFILIFSIINSIAFAVNNLRLPTALQITASKSAGFATAISLIAETSGDATSYSNAAKIYIPLKDPADNQDQAYYAANSIGILPENTNNTGVGAFVSINLNLTTDANSTVYYIRAAVQDGDDEDDFKVIALESRPSGISSANNQAVSVVVSLATICAATSCSKLDNTSGSNEHSFKILFYLSTSSNSGAGDPINFDDLSSYSGSSGSGVFFDFSFSDKFPIPFFGNYLKISNVAKGDERMTITYSEQGEVNFMNSTTAYKTVVFKDLNGCLSGNGIADCFKDTYKGVNSLNSDVFEYFNFSRSGEIVIKNLANNNLSCFTVALMNKYGFVSPMSNVACAIPLPIEAFIEEMQCYLLSAGFGEEHYVINYFRNFRDRILLRSTIGKLFVNLYYNTAPSIAPYIYKSKVLSFFVQTFSFILYFIFNYSLVFLILLFIALAAFLSTYHRKFRL